MAKKISKAKVSNEKNNLHRLAGEFLVASRLTQRGYMISLQWGVTISYDILVFDKVGNVAYLEVKSCASQSSEWVMQKKYAIPRKDAIPPERRFICCVDLSVHEEEPRIYVFPALVVAEGLHYYFNDKFPDSPTYHLSLDLRPQGQSKSPDVETVGKRINSEFYLENYDGFGVERIEA